MIRLLTYLVFTTILMSTTFVHADTRINLPGSVYGGVEICNVSGCKSMPVDRETPAKIISYHSDTGTTVQICGKRYYVPGNQIGLKYKGCSMTLNSYLAKSFCDGKSWR